ncbi:hypothetical protein HYT54_01675 [Candidatus Woesearchaeota archaeon]|nr:hypothetical protein [Candidatus Woesearchaeota archaeon]
MQDELARLGFADVTWSKVQTLSGTQPDALGEGMRYTGVTQRVRLEMLVQRKGVPKIRELSQYLNGLTQSGGQYARLWYSAAITDTVPSWQDIIPEEERSP